MEAAGPSEASQEASTCRIDDVPDQLLGHMFALVGLKGLLRAAPRVCRRWHEVFYSTPALWRQLEIDAPDLPADGAVRWPAWEAALARLLLRVGGFVVSAQLASRSQREAHWVASVLRQLQPGTATELSILAYQLPAGTPALEPLRRLTQLTSLKLNIEGRQLALPDPLAGLARLLPTLPLHSLRLDAHGLPQCTVDALGQLAMLTNLRLVSRAGPLPSLAALARLAQLRHLWVEDRSCCAPLPRHQLPTPADFPALQRYTFACVLSTRLQIGNIVLERIQFSGNLGGPSGGALLSAGTLHLTGVRVVAPAPHASARPLLAAAVPPRKQLHTLNLNECRFGQPGELSAQLGPQQLAQLRQLQLSNCRGQRSMDGVVEALLSSAPQLEGLQFMLSAACDDPGVQHLHSFPTAIFSHPTLTRAEVLSVYDERWDAFELAPLPDPSLEVLHAVGLTRLPPALAAVTSLTELRLGATRPFRLGARGLATLQQLPKLATLVLPPMASREDERRVETLQRDRPQLQVSQGDARRHQTCC